MNMFLFLSLVQFNFYVIAYAHVPLIITVGSTVKKPLVVDNEVKIRDIINVTLTLDHRYTDGARAAVVYQKFIKYLDNPDSCPKEPTK